MKDSKGFRIFLLILGFLVFGSGGSGLSDGNTLIGIVFLLMGGGLMFAAGRDLYNWDKLNPPPSAS